VPRNEGLGHLVRVVTEVPIKRRMVAIADSHRERDVEMCAAGRAICSCWYSWRNRGLLARGLVRALSHAVLHEAEHRGQFLWQHTVPRNEGLGHLVRVVTEVPIKRRMVAIADSHRERDVEVCAAGLVVNGCCCTRGRGLIGKVLGTQRGQLSAQRLVELTALAFAAPALALRFALALCVGTPLRSVVEVALPLALALALALGVPARNVCSLLDDLQLPAAEEGAVQQQRVLHALLVGKLDVGEALGAAGVLVYQDRDAIDLPARLEVFLQLLWRRSVVNAAHVH